MLTNWYDMLTAEMTKHGDSIEHARCTLNKEQLKVPFDDGYGAPRGKPFTAWGENRVYFPVVYDGAEWVGSARRNPCDEPTEHIGGW